MLPLSKRSLGVILSYTCLVVHILVTGENRNPSLFLSQIDLWKKIAERQNTPISILYGLVPGSISDAEKEILDSRGVNFVQVLPLENSRGTWEHQSNSLKALLEHVDSKSFVFKTRPDVFISSRLFEWIIKSVNDWPISYNPKLLHKIWTPWAHSFYPYLLDDKSFAGFAEDIAKLAHHDDSDWMPIFGDLGKEAHLRRWLPIFSDIGFSREFQNWFSSYSMSQAISSSNCIRMNKVYFGEVNYKKFGLIRFLDFLSHSELHESYLEYLKQIENSIHFYSTYDSCSEAFIDKWGPRMDSFSKVEMDISFFYQNEQAWVLFSENHITEKIRKSKVLELPISESMSLLRKNSLRSLQFLIPLLSIPIKLGIRKENLIGKILQIIRNPQILLRFRVTRKVVKSNW
jgi:hypothetical protein